MGPRRKKSKPNSQAPIDQAKDQPAHPQNQDTNPSTTPPSPAKPTKGTCSSNDVSPDEPSNKDTFTQSDQPSNRTSWYNGGSWRAKASPVAQATRESISVAGGATSEALAEGANHVGRYMHNTLKINAKSILSLPSETMIHATGSTTELDRPKSKEKESPRGSNHIKIQEPVVEEAENGADGADGAAADPEVKTPPHDTSQLETPLPPDPTNDTASQSETIRSQATAAITATTPAMRGWWGWWSRPDGYAGEPEKSTDPTGTPEPVMAEAPSTPLPVTPAVESPNPISGDTLATTPMPMDKSADPAADTANKGAVVAPSTSWFGLWSSAQYAQARPQDSSTQPQHTPPDEPIPVNLPPSEQPHDTDQSGHESANERRDGIESPPTQKSSGWAFWSRENKPDVTSTPNGTKRQKQIGELAVADTPSQSHPEAAQFNEERQQTIKAKKRLSKNEPVIESKNASVQETKNGRVTGSATSIVPTTPSSSPPATRPPTPDAAKSLEATKPAAAKAANVQKRPPHMVMPSFRETYAPAYLPSYWEKIAQYVASSLHLIDVPDAQKHVDIAPTFPKIKTAVAIGVHGYFPAPLIQKVLGPPTGTSIRFANHASAAIRTWTEANQPGMPCDIETVALEGEGFIADRVNTLWKLLLNWLSHLRRADLIFVACHSQGVPVAIMLVSKLIQLGCLSPQAKIGICSMAGVNLGPFADYKSRLLGAGSAAELFEFSRPGSKVSMEYASALENVLRHNVRISYCGSIDDQLVSLESSTFSNLTHPYIFRSVFIDGRIHAPDFITHLVAFALKLRNLGISDHGLIRELSLPLAGSLYGGQGHSTVYDDPAVYDLALQFCLETTDIIPSHHERGQREEAQRRRSSQGGLPSSVSAANAIRRGSLSASALVGIAPVLTPFEMPASGSNANPYFLPWALRGILEEDIVRREMGDEVKELVKLYEEWRPSSKVLKDVKFRLEGVRSKL
ncbi:hypothetical protein BDV97DRAFT_401279 [Delphinella strobiligena]|nr:hypothetical protein BDV97DRAFT_401279 [Delphinella strobiligena]